MWNAANEANRRRKLCKAGINANFCRGKKWDPEQENPDITDLIDTIKDFNDTIQTLKDLEDTLNEVGISIPDLNLPFGTEFVAGFAGAVTNLLGAGTDPIKESQNRLDIGP